MGAFLAKLQGHVPSDNATPLPEASLKPNFSAEAFVDGKRHYAAYGFANTGGVA